MADQTLDLQVVLDNGQFKVAVKGVHDEIDKTKRKVDASGATGKTAFSGLASAATNFSTVLKGIGVISFAAGLGKLVTSGLKSAAAFEMQAVALETMLKSSGKAKKLLDDLNKFAAKTPFELPGLIDATKKLIAFGTAQEDVIPTLEMLGNASMGNAEILDRLTLAYGKVQAKGKASMEELNMFTEAGVPLMAALADKFGVTNETLYKMVEQGKVGFPEVQEAMANLTTGSGQFAGMMEKQSMTLSGLFSTLKDNIGMVIRDFGQELSPAFKALTLAMIDAVNAGGLFRSVLNGISTLISSTVRGYALLIEVFNLVNAKTGEHAAQVQRSSDNYKHGMKIITDYRKKWEKLYNTKNVDLIEKYAKAHGGAEWAQYLDVKSQIVGMGEKHLEVSGKELEILKRMQTIVSPEKGDEGEKKEAENLKKQIKARQDIQKLKKGAKDKDADEFAGKQSRMMRYYDTMYTKSMDTEMLITQDQNKAAADYEAYLSNKFMLDSVYYQGLQTVANTASVFMAEKNKKLFRFGQALAIAQTWINTFQGMTKAYAQLGVFGGAGAGVIFAAGVLQTRRIAQQKPPEFAVGSVSIPKTMPAVVHQGEMIINKPIAEGVRSGDLAISGRGGATAQAPIIVKVDGRTLFEINEKHRDQAAQNIGSSGSFPVQSAY